MPPSSTAKRLHIVKRFGIRITMPPGDPLAGSHLLGEDWETHRWYETAEERDHAYREMRRQPVYYRRGDTPSVQLDKVEREAG